MDDESECDWTPPPEVELIESEVFQIPSGLPSLDAFIQAELEREAEEAARAAAAAAEAAAEAEVEEEVEADAQAGGDAAAAAAEAPADEDEMGAGDEEVDTGAAVEIEEDFDIPVAEAKPPKKVVKKKEDDWGDLDVKTDFEDLKAIMEAEAKEQLRLRLTESTHNYIGSIIDKVVEICEYEDPDEILRERLNKKALCVQLDEIMLRLHVEQKIRMFLNRKTVDYFHRKKAMRPLTDDSPETILNELRKYRHALSLLNNYKGREAATKELIRTKVSSLKVQYKELAAEAKAKRTELYQLVRRVFAGEGDEKMDSLVELLMGRMTSMRKEISNVRFTFIQRQHTMADLQNKARRLEDLGNGLRMADYEHLQTETQALGKKIEERNNELSRLHARCNADIHTLAHIREKQYMLRNTIAGQQIAYDELVEEKQNCREYLNSLKIDRGSIRRDIQKISFEGGLVDKPDLLLDFDVAMDKATGLRAKIAEMKAIQLVNDNKLKHMMRSLQ